MSSRLLCTVCGQNYEGEIVVGKDDVCRTCIEGRKLRVVDAAVALERDDDDAWRELADAVQAWLEVRDGD